MTIAGKEIKDLMFTKLGATSTTDQGYITDAVLRNCPGIPVHVSIDDGAGAPPTTALAESPILRVPYMSRLIAIYWTNRISVTANNTNFKSLFFYKRTGAGSAVQLATGTTEITGLGNITADVPVLIPLTSANVILAAGDVITMKTTATANGVVLGAAVYASGNIASFSIQLERIDAAS